MVIRFTTHILVMVQAQFCLCRVVRRFNCDLIQSLFENGFHAAAGGRQNMQSQSQDCEFRKRLLLLWSRIPPKIDEGIQ